MTPKTDAERLIKHGFIKDSAKSNYDYNEKRGIYEPGEEQDGYDESHADQEQDEEANISQTKQYFKTEYPKPEKRYRLIFETFNMSLESMYYWTLNHLRDDMNFPEVHKITDVFSASENSAMFGQQAQRKSIQEDRATNYLQGISELVKKLFQIVRELRVIDERLEIYENADKSKTADTTLKGIYADFAEGQGKGAQQPGSVYQLSQQAGYAVLPDLFFNTWIKDKENIDELVDESDISEQAKNVVKRKLYQYLTWKEKTYKELKQRRKFQIKYLRQHYTVIETYIGWVKPYLRHVKRLQMKEDEFNTPDLITSFETSSTEIEVLGVKPNPGNKYNSVVLLNYKYNTRPVMQYQQERHQGAAHIGKCALTIRTYAWTDEQIQNYKDMKRDEELELLGVVDDKLGSAMDMLGEELENYLKEAEGTLEDEEDDEEADAPEDPSTLEKIQGSSTVFDPFVSVFKGIGEIGGLFVPDFSDVFKSSYEEHGDPSAAHKDAYFAARMVYMNYKRAHGLLVQKRDL